MEKVETKTSSKEKYEMIKPWFAKIITDMKKDLRREHLGKDRGFAIKYFGNQPVQKIPVEQMVQGYATAIEDEQGELLFDLVMGKWVVINSDLYYHFESCLKKITPDFSSLTSIEDEKGQEIIDSASKEFGAEKTYLFCLFNDVVISKRLFEVLREQALKEAQQRIQAEQEALSQIAELDKQKQFEKQLMELKKHNERYEKKILGLQRIHEKELLSLKKQIAALQRQLGK